MGGDGGTLAQFIAIAGLVATIVSFIGGRLSTVSKGESDLRDDLREDRDKFKAEADLWRTRANEKDAECHEKEKLIWGLEATAREHAAALAGKDVLLMEREQKCGVLTEKTALLETSLAEKNGALDRMHAELDRFKACPLVSEAVCPMVEMAKE